MVLSVKSISVRVVPMEAETNLRLHQHIWNILVDLAVDDTLSEREAEDVKEAMGDLAEMLIDSLRLQILNSEDGPDGLALTVLLKIDNSVS